MRANSRNDRPTHRQVRGGMAFLVFALSVCVVAQPLFTGAFLTHSHGDEGSHTHRVPLQAVATEASVAVSRHSHGEHHEHDREAPASTRMGAGWVPGGAVIVCDADFLFMRRAGWNAQFRRDLRAQGQWTTRPCGFSVIDTRVAAERGASGNTLTLRQSRPSKNTAALVRTSPALLL